MLRPVSSSSDASRRMAKVPQKGTGAEVALRREMYRIGLSGRLIAFQFFTSLASTHSNSQPFEQHNSLNCHGQARPVMAMV